MTRLKTEQGKPMSKPRRRPTDAQIVEAIRASGAVIATAAKKVGMSRSALFHRIARTPKLIAVVEEVRESVLDLAESSLIRAITQGAPWATCFYLKCQGKNRGYSERSEVTGRDGTPVGVSAFEQMSDEQLRRIAYGHDAKSSTD
jgi:hypothetical protein